MNELS
ncbi:hypothetical protein YPPY55_0196, partial [Yersinia pestis PY-55]